MNRRMRRKFNKHKKCIRIISKRVDVKGEIKGLIFLEGRYPELVDKLRKERFNNRKSINNNRGKVNG